MLGFFKTKAILSRPMLSEAIWLKADVELLIIVDEVNILLQSVLRVGEIWDRTRVNWVVSTASMNYLAPKNGSIMFLTLTLRHEANILPRSVTLRQ